MSQESIDGYMGFSSIATNTGTASRSIDEIISKFSNTQCYFPLYGSMNFVCQAQDDIAYLEMDEADRLKPNLDNAHDTIQQLQQAYA